MKCSGKKLIKYLKLLMRIPLNRTGKRAALQRCFKAEHREAVKAGYVRADVKYIDMNNEQRHGLSTKVWIVTEAAESFMRQMRGDFQPPTPKREYHWYDAVLENNIYTLTGQFRSFPQLQNVLKLGE